jgi:hypothetical protein
MRMSHTAAAAAATAAAAAACSEFAKAVGISFKTPTEVFG